MNIFLVLAHPEPQSFNGALHRLACETLAKAGHSLRISDLYAMQFQPVSDRRNFITVKDPSYYKQQAEELHATEVGGFAPDVEGELQKVEWCDLMIWQFPLWWWGLPAILKGWVDRVFAKGRTYGTGRYFDTGVFRGKRALISVTTGSGPDDDLDSAFRPIQQGIFAFCGFSVLAPQVSYGAGHASDKERRLMLERYRTRLATIELEQPI